MQRDRWPEPPYMEEILHRLIVTFAPEKVVLFGSWARGEARPDSDLDVLVVANSSERMCQRMARAQHALRGLPVAVDVFVCTPEEAERYGRWLSHTVAIALREGRVLHAAAA